MATVFAFGHEIFWTTAQMSDRPRFSYVRHDEIDTEVWVYRLHIVISNKDLHDENTKRRSSLRSKQGGTDTDGIPRGNA